MKKGVSKIMKIRPFRIVLSAVLTAALLLLNFTVVALKETPVGDVSAGSDAAGGRPVALAILLRDAHDMQDPETTACRYAIRQVIRMGEPLPALLALAGTLPAGLPVFGSVKAASLTGVSVPRNAERIAAFLHDLAAAL